MAKAATTAVCAGTAAAVAAWFGYTLWAEDAEDKNGCTGDKCRLERNSAWEVTWDKDWDSLVDRDVDGADVLWE